MFPVQCDWWPYKQRRLGPRHKTTRGQGEDGCLQVQEKGLDGANSADPLVSSLQSYENMRFCCLSSMSVWLVTATLRHESSALQGSGDGSVMPPGTT